MASTYFLIFSMQFDRDTGLDSGRLTLNSLSGTKGRVWVATSATDGLQFVESFHQRGGLIPPQYRCKDVPSYFVDTNPIPMPETKGVEGNFYRISPYMVTTDKGGVRSDLGIHRDANVPGSMGCIVMTGERFRDFEKAMQTLRDDKIPSIPLFVQYS